MPSNPNVICAVENLTYLPTLHGVSDYLEHIKKVYKAGNLNYDFTKKGYHKSYSGVNFIVMPAALNIGHIVIQQEFIATELKGYFMLFVLSYTQESERFELHGILNTLEFK